MKKKLHLKGWTKEEIKKVKEIIKKAEKKKHPDIVKIENSLYWFALIIGIIGTVFFSLVLIPILIVTTNIWGYVITGIFGFLLGVLIIIIIKDLHWLENHHHLLISLIIPVIAIFNFFIVVNRVNLLNYGIGLSTHHNPIAIGVVYLACFIIPYIIFLLLKR